MKRFFSGAVVGLGALGIVTKVTLDALPTFEVRQDVYENLAFAQLEKSFLEILSSAYSVSLFTDWTSENFDQVWLKSRVEDGLQYAPNRNFFGAIPATAPIHPIRRESAASCSQQMRVPGPWHERLPHFRMEFTPSSGEELQSEYFVPIEFRSGGVTGDFRSPRTNFPVAPDLGSENHRRRCALDESLLSKRQPRDSLHLEKRLGGGQGGFIDY